MKKTDKEIEKMLLNDLEEMIVMGWADTSEKSLLLELIRERQVKNNIVLPDVIKSAFKCDDVELQPIECEKWRGCFDCPHYKAVL